MKTTLENNKPARSNQRQNNRTIFRVGLALFIAGLVQHLNAQTTVLFEGFEGYFPVDNGWYVGDNDPQGTPANWDDVYTTFGGEGTHGGNWKGYCAGVGYDGTSANPLYRDYMSSEMSRTINLVGYNVATLSFWYKIPSIETGYDRAEVYIDGIDHYLVWSATNAVSDWMQVTIDLSTYVGTSPALRFRFYSDSSRIYEGWYLDDILVTGYLPPSNDQCAGAIALSSCAPYSMSTMGATSTGDPLPTCRTNFGKGVWFTYTPASDGLVKISTCESSFDTVVQVYIGTCSALAAVACADDGSPDCPGTMQETVQFSGSVGTTYHILVGGYAAQSGTLVVRVLDTTPPSISCPNNIVANTDPGLCTKSNVTFTTTATDNCPGVTVTCNPPSGSTFPTGVNVVTCTATDSSGNTTTCTFTVTIQDAELPGSVWDFVGLAGRRVLSLAISPNYVTDHTLFAGTDAGVYRSTDRGQNWTLTSLTERVISMAISPGYLADKTVFAFAAFPTSYGLYRSKDGGTNWAAVAGISGYNVLSVAVSPDFTHDHTVFVGHQKSIDAGDNWTSMSLTNKYIYAFALSPDYAVDHIVFVGTDQYVYKSTDGGATWTRFSGGLTSQYVTAVAVTPDYKNSRIVFAGTSDGSMFKSTDGGENWTQVRSGAGAGYEAISAVAVSPEYATDRTLFAAVNTGLFTSTDGGATWSQVSINCGLMTASADSVAVSAGYAIDRAVFVGVYGGVFSYPHPLKCARLILASNGWSDPTVGLWNAASQTGTLTTNVTRPILIQSDGVTLDGNLHTVTPTLAQTGNLWSVGVFLDGRTRTTVKNLKVNHFGFGIGLRQSSTNTLVNNEASSNELDGIYLTDSNDDTLMANIAGGNKNGIVLGASTNNIVSMNTCSGNEDAGISLFEASRNVLKGNVVNANDSGIVLNESTSNRLAENSAAGNTWAGIYVVLSRDNSLTNNVASENDGEGIYVNGSSGNILTGNTASSNNWSGINVCGGLGNTLTENTASWNEGIGIRVHYYTQNNLLTGNTVNYNSSYGIWIGEYASVNAVVETTIAFNSFKGIGIADHSDYNQVLHNNFISNFSQASVDGGIGNSFNNPAPVGGNYWNNWSSPDANGDGFVDNPYLFSGGQDNLPWATQNGWEIGKPPAIGYTVLAGTNLVFGGTGGTAGGTYYVVTSTNVATPLINWKRVATNTFAAGGTFCVTNAIDPARPRQFFRLQVL